MESWDILDGKGRKTGETIVRGEELKAGQYHLVVHTWILNNKGEILIQKRPEHLKIAPGVWAVAGGSAIEGEDSLTAACREVKEELGMDIDVDSIIETIRYTRENSIVDIYVVQQDIKLEELKLQKEEVDDAKYVTIDELKTMIEEGSFHRYSDAYLRLLSDNIKLI